ncbi:VOC family protein [Cumulibacter manganitolerans]|uniref:VOC family protein n=1 Tax=Cumulibacter manganitolerans TaxID=1884992 RepID=UPI001E3EA65B|nr:VOC family protein [Cumulibacter manganitolerans]
MTGMRLRWYTVVVDSLDVRAQARWWAEVLDWVQVYDADDECVIVPRHASADPISAEEWDRAGPGIVFVTVPETKTIKNRLHLDLAPHLDDDRDAQIERLLAMGARRVDVGQDDEKVGWTVLADPEGNEFCVLSSRDR